ncbi:MULTISPECIES: serine/threonine protein kinase [unclassified Frankia]
MSLRSGDPERIARFTLTARLGSGGMGVVYLGIDDETGGPVALKVIRSDFTADPEFRSRFRREVAAARAVDGACTARLVDADPDAEDPWMATEHIHGQSLAEAIADRGALTMPVVMALATGLAEALKAIHDAGIVHRDLKPGNVILSEDGPKVIDFGIAAAVDATAATRTGVLLGSPGYMAPEQVTGRGEIGPPADVFAWGLTVLFAASGRPPFGTGRPDALLYRVVHDEADTGDVPLALRPAVRAALLKEPMARPSAHALLRVLIGSTGDPERETRRILRDAWLAPPVTTRMRSLLPVAEEDTHDAKTQIRLDAPESAGAWVRVGDGAGTNGAGTAGRAPRGTGDPAGDPGQAGELRQVGESGQVGGSALGEDDDQAGGRPADGDHDAAASAGAAPAGAKRPLSGRRARARRHPRRTAGLAALAATLAGLAALSASEAAGDLGPQAPGTAASSQATAGEPGPGPHGVPLTPSSRDDVPARSGRTPGPPGLPAPSLSVIVPPAGLSSGRPIPGFRGTVGQLMQAKAFTGFVTAHDTQIVFLDISTLAEGNEGAFYPGPDFGGDNRPNFTLFDACGALGPGEPPGFEPGKECFGSTYRLAEMAHSGASFGYVQGSYRLRGYFWVDLVPGMHQGFVNINLRAVDARDLPR